LNLRLVPQPSAVPPRLLVLVVEDELLVARGIECSLNDLGCYIATSVATGQDALRSADARRPDIVLMDIRIKGELDGIQTAGLLWQRHRVPVVYLTAYSDDKTLARAAGTRPYGYLLKPFSTHDLKCAIEIAHQKSASELRIAQQNEQMTVTDQLRSLSLLAASIAQEVNNPLACNLASLSFATRELASIRSEEVTLAMTERLARVVESLSDASQAAGTIAEIVADLCAFSAKEQTLRRRLDLGACIQWALRMTVHRLEQTLTLTVELGALPAVTGNELTLSQVFVSLLLNAARSAHAVGGPSQICVRGETSPSGEAIVEIAVGPADQVEGPSGQAEGPQIGASEESGFALPTCRDIIERLDGSLAVTQGLDGARTFRVCLPASTG